MNDFEDQLRQVPLAAPSRTLDRRMQAAFAAAAVRRGPERKRWIAWISIAGVAGAAAIALLPAPRAGAPSGPPGAAVEVAVQVPPSRLAQQFLDPSGGRPAPHAWVVKVTVQ